MSYYVTNNMPTHVHLKLRSGNRKTGPIPVSTTSANTCPPSCPFNKSRHDYARAAPCYAMHGHLRMHWAKVTRGERGYSWDEFCEAIAALPKGQLWRHNQAGDLPGDGEWVDHHKLGQLTRANRGRKGFTYTHKTTTESNLDAIRCANNNGFTVNLSANSLEHADQLADANAGPVVVVLPQHQTANTTTPAGRKVVVCPADADKGVTCATCRLCSRSNRSVVVGFPAHGAGASGATAISVASHHSVLT